MYVLIGIGALVGLLLLYIAAINVYDRIDYYLWKPKGWDTSLWSQENWRRWGDLGHPCAEYHPDDPKRIGDDHITAPGHEKWPYREPCPQDPRICVDGIDENGERWGRNRTVGYLQDHETFWREFYGKMPTIIRQRDEWEEKRRFLIKLRLVRSANKPRKGTLLRGAEIQRRLDEVLAAGLS